LLICLIPILLLLLYCTWLSTDKNGYGVSNMFAQLRAREDQLIDYCFLLVRSTSDYVFGAFLSHLPIPQPKLRPEEFFGDHSCFLFRLRPLSEVRVYRAASLSTCRR